MDIFLIIGVITGLLAIVVGMIVKGADVAVLLNPAAAIIILVGTFAAVMNSFPKKDFLKIPKIFGALFSDKQGEDPIGIVSQIVTMAQATRKNGLLSLEQEIEKMDNKFLKKGLGMVVDGIDPDYIKEVLEIEIDSLEERHRVGASVFTTAGGSAPTLGVLGAVIGLIGALANLNDTEKLAHMIAAAFVATLYGIFFGYVIFHPFATRLKRKSADEVKKMYIILEGILSIQSGDNPKSIETKLSGMLEPKDRERYENQNKGE
ncbi:flagellar motor stator protein MotA [Clostridium intestinale]|jgi:chemotaxis protein MotA|uniref:Flagellar motor protein MotA n=2 Tax=Clostridium intestinale TaxID=36845 RepID=U2N3P1_9CLOT|nr:flagellar motor stator protein MotA [Clostridium intestinale]ERK30102.1 flagellar motor protein MotA [Clostridium intestinale URNW]QLY81358.1 flagellar motor stator protein MotA [Clostridium intestinale]